MVGRILSLCLWIAVPLFGSSSGDRIEAIGSFSDTTASKSVRDSLEPRGYRIISNKDEILCEIWLRNGVTEQNGKEILGAIYTDLPESICIGVLSFPQGGKDFRGQSIRPGAYTLRYELLPNDGNHLGAAATRDFLLLTPVIIDSAITKVFKFDELIAMSRKTSKTHHPAVLSMTYPEIETEEDLPTVDEVADEYVVFTFGLKIKSGGRLPVALVVKGEAEQ